MPTRFHHFVVLFIVFAVFAIGCDNRRNRRVSKVGREVSAWVHEAKALLNPSEP